MHVTSGTAIVIPHATLPETRLPVSTGWGMMILGFLRIRLVGLDKACALDKLDVPVTVAGV